MSEDCKPSGSRAAADDAEAIEISSDSDSVHHASSASSISDSDDDHNSDKDSSTEEDNEAEFEAILAETSIPFFSYLDLCQIAFKLNDLGKIELAFGKFETAHTVPAHIWLKYLKTRLVVTQTPAERANFEEKCAKALSSFYDVPLAEFVVQSLLDQSPQLDNRTLWANLLADYGLERPDFINKFRVLLKLQPADADVAAIEQLMLEKCVTWSSSEEQLCAISDIVAQFKQRLAGIDEHALLSDQQWIQLHDAYIDKAEELESLNSSMKAALVKLIFERCLAKFPTVEVLWLNYLELKSLSEEQRIDGYLLSSGLALARRAVRCQPGQHLNHKLLACLEEANCSRTEVDSELSELFPRIESQMYTTVELQLDYLAYRVRHTNVNEETEVAELRAAFQNVWERLSEQYGELADANYEILQLWAQVEYSVLRDPTSGAYIWRQILGYSNTTHRSQLWLGFAHMESQFNGDAGTVQLLQEALAQPSLDNERQLREFYRRHERCYGSYESIARCQRTVAANESSRKLPLQQQRKTQATKKPPPSRKMPQPIAQRKPQQPPAPKRQQTQPKPERKQPQAQPDKKKKEPVEKKEPNFKFSSELEPNKIFIKNLHAGATKEELEGIFKAYGSIKDIRLVYRLNKVFKGIAFIEYELAEDANKAVAGADGQSIGGQSISVAISHPPQKLPPQKALAIAFEAAKRRVQTTLIPTTLVRRQEVAAKRRRLELEAASTGDAAATDDANGKVQETPVAAAADANGSQEASEASESAAPAAVAKSNDDFRKLFNI